MSEEVKNEKTKVGKVIEGAEMLSLGISMVVAVLIGVGIGLLLKNYTGHSWTLWIGVFWGVAAAVLNVYKAYKKTSAELEKLKDRYKNYKPQNDEDED